MRYIKFTQTEAQIHTSSLFFFYIPVYTSNIVHRNILLFIPFSRYTPAARLAEVIYDSTLVTFTYDEASGTVKTIHLTHNGFISSIRYRQTGNTCMGVRTHNLQQKQCAKASLSSGYLAISTQRGTIRNVCSVMRPLNHAFFFFLVWAQTASYAFKSAVQLFFSPWDRGSHSYMCESGRGRCRGRDCGQPQLI